MKITNNNIIYPEGCLWQTRNRNFIQEVKNCLLDIDMQIHMEVSILIQKYRLQQLVKIID